MHRRAAMLSIAIVLGAAPPVVANEIPPRVQALIDRLDADDASAREGATADLQRAVINRSSVVTPEMIAGLLRGGTLSPEQRTRLLLVDRALFNDSPKPGMGVRFGASVGPEGVVIMETVPGFNAADVLRSNDVVLTADGRTLTEQMDLRAAILSHDPGDEMTLTVQRGDEVLELRVVLGELAALQTGRSPGEFELEQAWAWRARRLRSLGPTPEPIDGRGPMHRTTRGDDAGVSLVAGGATRHVPDPDGLLAASDQRRREAAALAQSKFVRADAGNTLNMFRQLLQVREQMLVELNAITDRLGDERIPDSERQKLERTLELQRSRISALDDRIAEFRRQLNP